MLKKALVITFSPLDFDSRVRRQIEALAEDFAVTVCHPQKSDLYPWAQVSLSWKAGVKESTGKEPGLLSCGLAVIFHLLRNALLLLRFFRVAEKLPYSRYFVGRKSLDKASSSEYDLIVSNDVETLPLAFAVSGRANVVADLHEFAPGQTTGQTVRNKIRSQYMAWVCREYLSKCEAITVVSQAVSDLYLEYFQIQSSVLPSAPKYSLINPSDVDPSNIELVHHGMYSPNRGIELLIQAVAMLPSRFSLHLVLTGAPKDDLLALARSLGLPPERLTIYDFVQPESLIAFLNGFDVEVIFIPPLTLNTKATLPNKFFEAIQARLAVVSGPTQEIQARIDEHKIGATVGSFEVEILVEALRLLTANDIVKWKAASHETASLLNWEAFKPDYMSYLQR